MPILTKLFGDPNDRVVRSYAALVADINRREASIRALDDAALRARVAAIRSEVAGDPGRRDGFKAEVFGLTREAARRALGQRHFDVQLIGGAVLHEGKIAEMRTGEGKTLVATLPVALNALDSRGVHVVTVNDYLAKRDAGWMGQVYDRLGLSCAAIVHEAAFQFDAQFENDDVADPLLRHLRPVTRREAYQADITYGTNNEFGFDFLRDNMALMPSQLVQRDLQYAIVDEVDSILIDEARTPLIISAPVERPVDEYRRIDGIVKQLAEGSDYQVDEKLRSTFLTDGGTAKVERLLGVTNLYAPDRLDLLNIVTQALRANARLFERDKQYVVRNGEVVIVDEFTGRLMFGRRYSEGLHQAIEAKEGVDIQQESQTLATITFQNLFRLYRKLAGMTGTAATEAEEFHKIYHLDVVVIPTNRPMIRRDLTDSVYKTELGKLQAVTREIKRRHEAGQPVLAGTISIAKNELLSQLLEREGVPHEVLNAKNHEREAMIIAQAGQRGAVTIATNMAGRGVDIILGGNPPEASKQAEVLTHGGLHVIGTERHESRRIDLQLRGRSGRQGDPGSSQFFLSMEDDLMRIFGSERMKSLMDRMGIPDDMPIENRMITRSIESAQRKVEGHNFDIRKHLVEYDDVMNKHREVIYRKRREILRASPEDVHALANGAVEQELQTIVSLHTADDRPEAWDLTRLYDVVHALMTLQPDERKDHSAFGSPAPNAPAGSTVREAIIGHLVGIAERRLQSAEQSVRDPAVLTEALRGVMLRSMDVLWIEHLDLMERLREGIGLRGYGQRDPLVEYKREAYRLFTELMNAVNAQIAAAILKVAEIPPQSVATEQPAPTLVMSAPAKTMADEGPPQSMGQPTPQSEPTSLPSNLQQIGRNDPCPCGSGKKFKKCYLANDPGCRIRFPK